MTPRRDKIPVRVRSVQGDDGQHVGVLLHRQHLFVRDMQLNKAAGWCLRAGASARARRGLRCDGSGQVRRAGKDDSRPNTPHTTRTHRIDLPGAATVTREQKFYSDGLAGGVARDGLVHTAATATGAVTRTLTNTNKNRTIGTRQPGRGSALCLLLFLR